MDAGQQPGGRAKRINHSEAGIAFDNGQHILIGAYQETRALMRSVGINEHDVLMRLPLDVRNASGLGLELPHGSPPWNFIMGIVRAKGWSWSDKLCLLRAALGWQMHGFSCPTDWSVHTLCDSHRLTPAIRRHWVEPLCLSALNTDLHQASASVFLRVLQDALLSGPGGSDFLIPTTDLSQVFPDAALAWLEAHGANIQMGRSVDPEDLNLMLSEPGPIVLATSWRQAALLTHRHAPAWSTQAQALQPRSIATVYLRIRDEGYRGLPRPILALECDAPQDTAHDMNVHHHGPAQFVFCRETLLGQPGVVAAVVSDCRLSREAVALQVREQIRQQLGWQEVDVLQTMIDKHATFACTPGLQRPSASIAPSLWACGDYVDGPYPATLEGAVRSGLQVIAQIAQVGKA